MDAYTRIGVVPAAEAMSMAGVDFMRKLMDGSYPAPPIAETSDIWLTAVDVGRVVFEGRPSARFHNPMGGVHGGWIATLLDSAMGCAVHAALEAGQYYTTVEMKTVFVRAVSEAGGVLRCEAQVLHKGGRVASSEGKVFDAAGRLVAYGSETCLVMSAGT